MKGQKFLVPVKDTTIGFYGYKKPGSKIWAIKPSFDQAQWLINGSAIVVKDKKYGLINDQGKFLIQTNNDILFGDSLLTFKRKDTMGIIDRKGRIRFQAPLHQLILDEESGIAHLVKDSLYGYWEKPDIFIPPFSLFEIMFQNQLAYFETDHSKGFINKKGEKIVEISEGSLVELDGNGFIIKVNNKERLLNNVGNLIGEFDKIIQVKDSFFIYRLGNTYQVSFLNQDFTSTDKKVELDEIFPFNTQNIAVARQGNLYGMIDNYGNAILPFEYNFIESFFPEYKSPQNLGQEKPFVTLRKDALIGVVNNKGDIMIQPQYLLAKTDEELVLYTKGDTLRIIDILSHKNIRAADYLNFSVDRAIVCFNESNNECGLIDRSGKFHYPPEAKEIINLYNGMFIISRKEGVGIMDSTGRILYPTVLNKILSQADFLSGAMNTFTTDGYLYLISKSGKTGISDLEGNTIIDTLWQDISLFDNECECFWVKNQKGTFDIVSSKNKKISSGYESPSVFIEKLAIVKKKGKFGLVNSLGKAVVPIKYQNVRALSNGLFYYQEKGKWGLLSSDGKILSKAIFSIVTEYTNGYSLVKKSAERSQSPSWGFLNEKGVFISGFKTLYNFPVTGLTFEESALVTFGFTEIDGFDELSFQLIPDSSKAETSVYYKVNYKVLQEIEADLSCFTGNEIPVLIKSQKKVADRDYRGKGIEIKSVTEKTFSIQYYREEVERDKVILEDSLKVFWIKNNSLARVYLSDLFQSPSWHLVLNEIIASKIQEQEGTHRIITSHGSQKFFDANRFVITSKGLLLFLNQNALGVEENKGSFEMVIPYEELVEIVKKDGALEEFFK